MLVGGGAESGVPHFPQNGTLGGFVPPQRGQLISFIASHLGSEKITLNCQQTKPATTPLPGVAKLQVSWSLMTLTRFVLHWDRKLSGIHEICAAGGGGGLARHRASRMTGVAAKIRDTRGASSFTSPRPVCRHTGRSRPLMPLR